MGAAPGPGPALTRGAAGSRPARWRAAGPPLLFLALAVALFPRILLGESFFHYDTWMQNLAFRAWWFAELKAGHFATWCPGMFAGYPLFAESQTGPLYPPTFVLFLLLPAPAAFSWSVLLHFSGAGLGAWWLARRLGAGPAAAVFAGAAYELSGFLVVHVVHFNLLTGAAWAPWTVAFAWEAGRGNARSAPALAVAVAMLLLGAHPYATMMTLMLVALAWAVRGGADFRALGRGAAVAGGAVLLGTALAAVQVLPTRELIARSSRGGTPDWSFLTFGSFPPWHLPALAAPDLFGTPVDGSFWGGPDWSHFAETCAYAGLPTLALALVALLLRRDRATLFLGAGAAAAFVLMLGKYTPLYHVVSWIPLLQSTRLPARFALPWTLAVTALAGLGLDALAREAAPRRRRAVLTGGAAVIALAAAAWWTNEAARSPDPALAGTGRLWTAQLATISGAARGVLLRLALGLAGTLGALGLFLRGRVPRAAAPVVLVVLVADLLSWGRSFNPTIPGEWIMEPPPVVAALPDTEPRPRVFRQGVDEVWARTPGTQRTDPFTPAWRGREASYRTASWSLPPNVQLLYGVDSGEGFTSLLPSQWLEWMGLAGAPGAAPRPELTDAQADLLAVDAVISTGAGIAGEGWDGIRLPGDVWVSRNADPLPRVRRALSWETVGDRAELLARVRAERHDPRAAVLLEEAPPGLPATSHGGRADEPVEARETGPGRWEIRVPPGGGLVVVAESWDPDWRARTAEGDPLPVVRADGLFAAFPAPAAGGRVTLSHAPGTVRAGAVVSAAALLALAALAFGLRGRVAPATTDGRPPRTAWVLAPAGIAVAVAAVSAALGVGGARADRAAAGLEAAAVRSWSDEALAARNAGALEPAAQLLRQAVRVRPDDAAALYRLGLVERDLGHPAEARAAFQRALKADPSLQAARDALDATDSPSGDD